MKDFLRHLLTGIDNHTYDIARVLWFWLAVQFSFEAAWALIVNKQPFDPVQYASGVAAVLTAGGFAVRVKSITEPK